MLELGILADGRQQRRHCRACAVNRIFSTWPEQHRRSWKASQAHAGDALQMLGTAYIRLCLARGAGYSRAVALLECAKRVVVQFGRENSRIRTLAAKRTK